jgi:hypothetical protein
VAASARNGRAGSCEARARAAGCRILAGDFAVRISHLTAAPLPDAGESSANSRLAVSLDVVLEVADGEIEQIAQQAAKLLAEPAAAPADEWLRGADRIAAYIDCPRSRVYALTSAGRIPVERDGASLIARRSELDKWVRSGGSKRP